MTPKEKAKELYNKMRREEYHLAAKYCALIAVDEILKITWVDKFLTVEDYWQEVKQEIEKL